MSHPKAALLLTKTAFDVPRDGGTLRVAAISRQLNDQLDVKVHSVAVEGVASPSGRGQRMTRWRLILPNVRVVLRFLQIGSLSSARWYRPRVVREIMELQRDVRPDLRLIEYSQLLGYRPIFDGPVALDMHNIESELMTSYAATVHGIKSWIARYEASRIRSLEKSVAGHADLITVVSEHDGDELKTLMGPNQPRLIVVAPNGVGDAGFELDPERENDVVFVAHLGWTPNVSAAVWLVEEVWPYVLDSMPEARLKLVGRSPARNVLSLASSSVSVHADVDSVLPYVARARVATAPLLAAGGTRLKILEALSCGTPVVSTSLGALGLTHLPGDSLTVVDEPYGFAQALLHRLRSTSDRGKIRGSAEPSRWPLALRPLMETLVGDD